MNFYIFPQIRHTLNEKGSVRVDTIIYFFLTFAYVLLLIWAISITRREEGLDYATTFLLFVIIGLIYDNGIIALGKFIGKGELLQNLSVVRFIWHSLFTPTLILFGYRICKQINLSWTHKPYLQFGFILLTISLIIYEFTTSTIGINLEPNWKHDVLVYQAVDHSIPIMILIVTIVLFIISIILIKKCHSYILFFGIVLMVLGSIISNWMKYPPLMNLLEFVLLFTLVKTLTIKM